MPIDPAGLIIRTYPDRVLRARTRTLPSVTDEVRRVAHRMIELMFDADGIGLAAPQVGLDWRMFVAHVPENDDRSAADSPPSATAAPEVYINPVLSNPLGSPEPLSEGCLSLPEISGEVLRPPTITITAIGLDGSPFTRNATGLLARCWQHEVDHLDGVLIIDRMTQMSRLKNRSAVRELERAAPR
ncbi:MAG: peptide deformylase [Phycisphaeraceae bacterium]|nr:peptide deformylase [Phycisphaeraceae bacterium]